MPEGNSTTTSATTTGANETAATETTAAATVSKGADAGAGGKDAILADLAKERDKRQELEKKITDFEQAQKDQTEALAKALGVKTDDAPNATDALAEQIKALQEQMAASSREATILKLAAKPGEDDEGKPLPAIPTEYHHLLTATEPDALAAQAKAVAELVAGKAAQNQTPGFAESAGQGQNGGPTPALPAQIAEAEKALRGTTPGSAEAAAAAQRVMALKSQQLFAEATSAK